METFPGRFGAFFIGAFLSFSYIEKNFQTKKPFKNIRSIYLERNESKKNSRRILLQGLFLNISNLRISIISGTQ